MDNNISYTENQDTLEKEQTNAMPEQLPEPEVKHTGSTEQDLNVLGMTDEEFLNGNVPESTNYQEPTQLEPQPNNTILEQPNPQEVVPETGSNVETKVSHEDFVKAVTSEFTANGRKVKIEDPEDIIRLMQMGLNYNKKMEVIKPNLGMIKTLQEHGINSLEELQFLIDLKNHDKTAIAKLIQDSQLDTYDLPDLEESPYVPKAKVLTNEQAAFDDVIKDVQALPNGEHLLRSLSGQTWDDRSLQFFQEEPQAIYALYEDKQSGLYDEVLSIIDTDKSLGRIPAQWLDKPFVELYEFVASELAKQRNVPTVQEQPQVVQHQPKVVGHNIQQPEPVRQVPTAPKSASIVSGSNQNILTDIPDFLSMTDEQFEAFSKSAQGLRF